MATTQGSASKPLLSDQPWALIAIPLGIVAGLGVLAVLLHSRRRRRRKSRLAVSSDPRVRQALERDLQEAWVRGATDRNQQQQPTTTTTTTTTTSTSTTRSLRSQPPHRGGGGGARWVRPATTRWAWARDMVQARADEGLNELGEAPPPYDGSKRLEKLDDGDVERGRAGVELDVLGPPPADGRSEPPEYGEQQVSPGGDARAAPAPLARPPPAVLPDV